MKVTEKLVCRFCKTALPKEDKLSLGVQDIVDFVEPGKKGRGKAPLDLVLCHCGLLQLRHTVDSDTLFKKFWYRSGINEQMRAALKDIVDSASNHTKLKSGDWVLDIGANDGTLLSLYGLDVNRVAFEPAEELAREMAYQSEFPVIVWNDYFNKQDALQTSGQVKYKVVTAIAMFYDLEEPLTFCRDVAAILDDNGVFIIQMNYLGTMLQNMTFDNIGHEHLCYYSLTVLTKLLAQAGLMIEDVELNDVNGGSIRVYAKKNGRSTERYMDLWKWDAKEVHAASIFEFAMRMETVCQELYSLIHDLSSAGKKVYAYGASTRGLTLLQTIFPKGDAKDFLIGVAERDVHKVGLEMHGLALPIVSEEEAREKADYFLLLPYHFWPSISKREHQWMVNGGKFIMPVPYPKVVLVGELGEGQGLVQYAIDPSVELEHIGRHVQSTGV